MLFTEFNLEDAKKVWLEEGRESERETIAFTLFGMLVPKTISEKTGLSIPEII